MNRRFFCLRLVSGILSACLIVRAQAQSPENRLPAFDVASIHPAVQAGVGEGSSRSQIAYSADSLTMRNIDLAEMVEWAYDLDHFRVTGPGLTLGARYDVRARAGEAVSLATSRVMLQSLLATRFKVQVHREQKRTSVYELVVARGGPKLPQKKADEPPAGYPRESLPRIVDGNFLFSNVSMGDFAAQLTELRGISLPVLDRTGIAGVYDITLKSAASAILESDGSALFSLIRDQLGLKLVSAKDPIEVLVVDHAEKPSAN